MPLPNFFVAGVPKAGTTSLHRYLRQHPQIYMSSIKEPTFFGAADLLSRDEFRRRQERERAALQSYLAGPQAGPAPLYVTDWDNYVQLFRNVREETAIGEASAGYFWLPSAARAIRAKVPHARLIFVFRDPAERLFSWYLLSLSDDPDVTFRAWFLKETRPREDWWTCVDGGRYATHLVRFLENFPRDQVRVYLHESLRNDARAVLRDIFQFLGVDPDQPIDVSHRHNTTAVPRWPGLERVRRRMLGTMPLTGWFPTPARRALQGLYHRRREHFMMDAEDRRMAIDYYRDEILRTADLIGRDLSAWLR